MIQLLDPGDQYLVDHRFLIENTEILPALIRQADTHRVAALAATAWQPYLPAHGQRWRKRILLKNWTLHHDRLRQLEQILEHLDAAGVETICLKGPALACRYYDPPFMRKPSDDLDFAVRACDIDRALRALAVLGYEPEPVDKALACNHHVELFSTKQLLNVELHFRLSHGAAGIPVDEFYGRAQNMELPSRRRVRILGDADQLLHLLLHAAAPRALFHLVELRRVSRIMPPEIREAAIRRAVEGHFAGVVGIVDQAFRYYWSEAFVPPGMSLPETWLKWSIGPDFHLHYRNWKPARNEIRANHWLRGRWLDFRITDQPQDALRLIWGMMKSIWYRLKNGR